MKKITIAIDGYSGVGKSTTAKHVAEALSYQYVDTGAMYRAVTYYFLRNNISLDSVEYIQEALDKVHISFQYNPDSQKQETILNGENIEAEIRKMDISQRVSDISAIAEVRKNLVEKQKEMGINGGIVMDGRDIGTNVFPDAELKIFINADVKVRAKRRQKELAIKGQKISLDEIIDNLEQRDYLDTTRQENPLQKASDAYDLDTTHLSIQEQTNVILELVQKLQLNENK